MAKKHLQLLIALVLLAISTSCFTLRQNPHYYVLVAEPRAASAGINLEDVKLASYLDRHELCYLAKTGELVRLPKAKWAQPLGSILKNYLTTATRPPVGILTDDTPKATIFLDQFLMNEDGSFQVAGAVEMRGLNLPTQREGFTFLLPSRGKPSVATMIDQSQLALEKILAEQLHVNK
ncbi:MAG: membrane integrity-associated transporter subunit PqiC [Victivallales bacterium]|nr:membrane integrity-associated transporter subunit PqiC [Victivallales bacterium]